MDMNTESLAAWDRNAEFWDKNMGDDGNDYYKIVEVPVLQRMAGVRDGDRALDIATGNGLAARWLASQGASVLATDGSKTMLEYGKRRAAGMNSITFELLDVTSSEAFERFIEKETANHGLFDIVVVNMAIMDISTLEPLAAALPRLLKKGTGRFVATILHPLMTAGITRLVEFSDDQATGREQKHRSIKLSKYLHVPPQKGVATKGQPFHQYHFHRPIHELLAPFLRSGLVLDALEEPNFDEDYVASNDLDDRSLRTLTQIPKILAFRLRTVDGIS
ncbi:hypothetical protein FQN50_004573 [Emmonsiellopsis sp. PD_5]|nr:hypothetical protein FQN50_004573 [Emmonsiellopsis sp. PD_5]